jgi:CheY-like chemotaxis protein/HPt (histidine-containing phosphotransfer) domain-containing protein
MRPLLYRGAARGLKVVWSIADDAPETVVADAGRLRQVLINLVGNAIKFTDSGSVSLSIECPGCLGESALLRFVVVDSGIGMPPEKLASIFEPFTQLDSPTAHVRGGTGLGLPISARLVELMGGRLFVSSQPTAGTTFSFTIPVPVAAPAEAAEARAASPAPAPRPLRILVAEDNPINQKLVLSMLDRAGYIPTLVSSGTRAVEEALAGSYDAVLMDVQMPGLDGLDATVAIRQAERGSSRHLPIIAMTAHAMPGDMESCLAAGMDDYLSKPIRLDSIIRKIEALAAPAAAPAPPAPPQTSPSPPSAPMTYLDSAKALARVGEDSDLLAELSGLFLAEYPRLLDAIRQGFDNRDSAAVQNAAHQLKGLLAQFCADSARDSAWQLELAAREGDLPRAASAATQLAAQMELLRPELEALASR